jgi:aspartate aminotransferase
MELSKRAAGVPLSVTLALDARAKELAASGRDVINMSVGEPDFDAPEAARQAAARRALEGPVRYTPAAGSAELRSAIAKDLTETRGVPFEPAQVTVCHSTKHALSGAVLTLVDPGDEVLLLLPAWVSYFEIVKLAGGVPVAVPARPDCGPDLDAIRAAITPRTKVVLVNSPSNPTGYVWSAEEMEGLAELCVERGLWIVSDEIYRRLVYEGPPNPTPVRVGALGDRARDHTVVLDGASKAYAMTGYRIGYAAGPQPVAAGIARVHSHLTGCPNAISQEAFRAALDSEPPEFAAMVGEFSTRRDFLLSELEDIGLPAPTPRGAFYAFPNAEAYLDERGAEGFCEDLLEQHGLALVPGSAFGDDRHVRLSYALSLERIREATERLRTFLSSRG